MNVSSKKWRVYRTANIPGATFVENRQTGESKIVKDVDDHAVVNDHERTFDRKCKAAFESGTWPN